MAQRFMDPQPDTTIQTPEMQARITLCETRLLSAIEELVILTRFISQPLMAPATDYVIGVMTQTNLFCTKINLALASDSQERPNILPIPLFEYFTSQIQCFNTILSSMIHSQIRVETHFQNRLFNWTLVNPTTPPATVAKRTSAYLKEIVLIQDLSIEEDAPVCDCPLCFDKVAAADIIVTNCKHSFCGTCVKGMTNAIKDKTKKPDCPMCRTDLTEFKIGNQQVYNDIQEHILNL
jgi:hypothetical protein